MTNPAYVLGHSSFELERLARQDRLIAPTTHDYFREAGIAPGMRVLDVGSGAGSVAFLAADIVGPTGTVIGTDVAPAAIAAATAGAARRGLSQVSFRAGDPALLDFDRPFDAVVGRYVLMFQAEPEKMLRQLSRHLRPGGIILFHEPDWSFVRSDPVAPLYDRCCRWIMDAFDNARTSSNMSVKLRRAFVDAGLAEPVMRMRAVIGDAKTTREWVRSVAELVIVLAPAIERQGVASAQEINGDSLIERLIEDVASNHSTIVGRAEIGAWSTV